MKGAKSKSGSENKLAVKQGGRKTKKEKPAKDPNKPKRPASAFFVFMEEFRKEFKEKHPENRVMSIVGKAGGEKWKSMTDEEKTPYVAKAETRKTDYEKAIKAYNNGETAVDTAEETDANAVGDEDLPDKAPSDEDEDASDTEEDD